jgi:hypothetical protein
MDIPISTAEELPSLSEAEPPVAAEAPQIDLDAVLESKPASSSQAVPPPEMPSVEEPVSSAPTSEPGEVEEKPQPAEVPDLGIDFSALMSPPAAPESPVVSGPETTAAPEPVSAPEPATASPVVEQVSDSVYFSQGFDDEPTGQCPEGWRGEYDYASLLVDDTSPANGEGRCLKFEKKSGAGSANFVCEFPKVTGHVIVEFDIRCDDKNKYLLGFYIEKDEDFKQSVHTIVHRLDSKSQPSLRIQGEPIPYEFGSWCHLKYDINLLLGTLNAFVNDQQIVKDGKLPTNPAYLNTLSIRDNTNTTGVLMLDGIKIYKG